MASRRTPTPCKQAPGTELKTPFDVVLPMACGQQGGFRGVSPAAFATNPTRQGRQAVMQCASEVLNIIADSIPSGLGLNWANQHL